MHGDVYFDTYKRYKAGTKTVVQWLAETAGYKATTAKQPARKSQKAVVVPLDALPQLASKIVQSDPLPLIPRHVLLTLEWVISARKECAVHHKINATSNKTSAEASNSRHEHFLDILVRILDTLRLAHVDGDPFKRYANDVHRAHDSLQQAGNRFEGLDLHEPASVLQDDVHMPPRAAKQNRSDRAAADFESVEQDDSEESLFACSCFLQDWYRIRMYLRDVWNDYERNKVSLLVAAITSNMALDTVERLHANLTASFPAYVDYEMLDELIINEPKLSDLAFAEPVSSDMREQEEFADIYDFQAPLPGREVYTMLKHFSRAHQKGIFKDFPLEENGFDWTNQCAGSAPARTQIIMMDLLVRLIPDMIAFMGGLSGSNYPIDQLTAYVYEFYKSHVVTVPLVFACEVFIDILFVLLSDIYRPFNELNWSAARATDGLKKYAIHTSMLGGDRADRQANDQISVLEVFLEAFVTDDRVAKFRLTNIRPKRDKLTSHCLLKHHPMLCGMVQFHIDRSMHYLGLRLVNDWMCLSTVLHLYNAARQRGYLTRRWLDLDEIIECYGESHVFVGELPTSINDFLGRLQLAQGIPISASGRESRKKQNAQSVQLVKTVQVSRGSGRVFDIRTPVLTVMRERYKVAGKKAAGIVLRDLEAAIDTLPQLTPDVPDDIVRLVQQWQNLRVLAPLDLLNVIRTSIQREQYQLHFDYIDINRRCIELLRRLRDFVHDHKPNNGFAELYSQNRNLYVMGQAILYSEDPINKSSRIPIPCPQQGTETTSLLQATAQRMDDLIKREGSKVTVKARSLC